MSANTISIFKYLDYRQFLKDWFAAAKQTRAGMSYRRFSERAGLKSWNFIMLIMQEKRNLTVETIPKVAMALKLNKQETEFFTNLVHYNQADSAEEQDLYYQKLLRSRKYKQLRPIRSQQYEYCSKWYHAVVRELITAKGFDGTAKWIADRLIPVVSPEEVAQSLQLLAELGFIEKTKQGKWKQAETLVSTGIEVESIELYNYHVNMLGLTKGMLEAVPSEQRDISALTLGVSKDKLPKLKKKIQGFRQELLKYAAGDTSVDDVVQVNMYFFPVTRTRKKKAQR